MSTPWFVSPHHVLRVLLLPYAVGAALVASVILTLVDGSLDEAFAAWTFAGLLFGGGAALLTTAVVLRVDRAQLRAPAPARWLLLAACGAVFLHWAPMALYLPVAVFRVASDSEPLRHLFVALNPVWLCSGSALAAWWLEGPLRYRHSEPGLAARPVAGISRIPAPWLVAGVYAAAVAMPSVAWLVWTSTVGWERGVGGLAIATWSLLGLGLSMVTASGGAPLVERLEPATSRATQRLYVAGLVLVAHWLPWFALALLRGTFSDVDTMYLVLCAAFGWIVLGTWVASVGAALGRLAEVARARSRAGALTAG